MELRFHVTDGSIERVLQRTDLPTPTTAARDSIYLMDWATRQAQAGHSIASIDPSGGIHTFETPAIVQARENQQRW